MNQERFRFFQVSHYESDLLIGVPRDQYSIGMDAGALAELKRLRNLLNQFIIRHPSFQTSLNPVRFSTFQQVPYDNPGMPEEIATMIRCGKATRTGPMSSVAGLFAEAVGEKLMTSFGVSEVVVENGGDLFLSNTEEISSVIHAGLSPLSDKMAFVVPEGRWGICTSSGTMGHSFSYGKADAVTVICGSAPLADAWATSLANRVSGPDDIEPLLEKVTEIPEILGCAAIVGERIGIRGEFEVKLLS